MDDLARPVDDATGDDQPVDAGVADDAVRQPDRDGSAPQVPSAEEAAAAAAADRAAQGSLFATDPPPELPVDTMPEDERVTAFGGVPDDLEAIRMELGEGDVTAEEPQVEAAPGEEPEAAVVEGEARPEPEAATVIAAATAADAEASAAVIEAGLPEGADDDADAVEALLDAEAEQGLLERERPDRILSVPYFVYVGVWLVFTIAMVVVLRDAAVGRRLDTEAAYPLFVIGGLVLTVLGPILSVVLWLIKRARSNAEERVGLFASAILRGSLATFAGVVLWMIGLLVLNYLKTGRLY